MTIFERWAIERRFGILDFRKVKGDSIEKQ